MLASRLSLLAISALFALGACVSTSPSLDPQGDEVGNPARGLAYARDICAACHAVERGDLHSPNAMAPPFQRVADTPGLTRLAFIAWMRSSHPNMPDFVVSDEGIDDLHAYIGSIASR